MALEQFGMNLGSIDTNAIIFWLTIIFVMVLLIIVVLFFMYVAKFNKIIEIWEEKGNGIIEIRRLKAKKVTTGGMSEYHLLFRPKSEAIKPEDSPMSVYKEGKRDRLMIYKRNDQEYDPVVFDYQQEQAYLAKTAWMRIKETLFRKNVPVKKIVLHSHQFVPFTKTKSTFKPIPQSSLLWGMTKFKEIEATYNSDKINKILQMIIPVVMIGMFVVVVILLLKHLENFESNIMSQASQVVETAKMCKSTIAPA